MTAKAYAIQFAEVITMCGIIGFTGNRNCVPILLDGLGTLEYRGYDSAGVAVETADGVALVKSKGRLEALRQRLATHPIEGNCGIGHTRWATHGVPSDTNSHPHSAPSLTLVHNGIIENYAELKAELEKLGYTFVSDTDTEVAAMQIDLRYKETGDPVKALFAASKDLRGSYAFGVIFNDCPHKLYAMRRDSPLIVAKTDNAGLIASDIPAILSHTRTYYRPGHDVVVTLDGNDVHFILENGEEADIKAETVAWDVEAAQKMGYPHFMLKEINEEPDALHKTVAPRLRGGLPFFDIPLIDSGKLTDIGTIHIIACGTAMHAGLFGKAMIEKYARIRVNVDIASEFRYCDPILAPNDLVILISQSGETADTLAALRLAKERGIRTLAVVNVVGSSVAREADDVIYTWAGPEIAVASTKAYMVQCATLTLFAVRLALAGKKITEDKAREICSALSENIPQAISEVIAQSGQLDAIAERLHTHEHIFYIGRGIDSILCTEGALKLKEISYIHCEAYAAGELKHGTISLIEEGTPVVAVITDEALCEKMISGIREVKSRGAYVVAIVAEAVAKNYTVPADEIISIPAESVDAPLPAMTALQLIAYKTSARMGLDVDCPRNLAKSVTVE